MRQKLSCTGIPKFLRSAVKQCEFCTSDKIRNARDLPDLCMCLGVCTYVELSLIIVSREPLSKPHKPHPKADYKSLFSFVFTTSYWSFQPRALHAHDQTRGTISLKIGPQLKFHMPPTPTMQHAPRAYTFVTHDSSDLEATVSSQSDT